MNITLNLFNQARIHLFSYFSIKDLAAFLFAYYNCLAHFSLDIQRMAAKNTSRGKGYDKIAYQVKITGVKKSEGLGCLCKKPMNCHIAFHHGYRHLATGLRGRNDARSAHAAPKRECCGQGGQ